MGSCDRFGHFSSFTLATELYVLAWPHMLLPEGVKQKKALLLRHLGSPADDVVDWT